MTRTRPNAARMRLQKFLAEAGVASRRHAEELIAAGRVLVNGAIVDQLPAFVDPASDQVVVDGAPARIKRPEYFIMHKPKGVVCTNRDPTGRPRAIDLLPPTRARLNVVGRLDADSTGLLLLTNDGDLAERITHPRHGVPKVYRVEVRGQVPADIAARLKTGVRLAEGKATASGVVVVHRSRQSSVLMITLREGRNRQVRRMLAHFNHPVKTLKRVQIGPLDIKGLPVGACRRLTARELAALRRTIDRTRRKREPPALEHPRGRKPTAGEKLKTTPKQGPIAAGSAARRRPREPVWPPTARRRLIK